MIILMLLLIQGYQKIFHNELSDYDNESLYIPIAPILSEEFGIPMMADEDAVDHIPKTIPQCDKSHGCDQGDAGGVHDIVGTLPTFWWGGGGVEPPTNFKREA